MSVNQSHQQLSARHEEPRRTLSTHDKMEAARARRAELLSGGKSMGLSSTAKANRKAPEPATEPADAPEPRVEPLSELRTEFISPEPVPQPRSNRLRSLTRSLFLMLIALSAIAVYQIRTTPLPASTVVVFEPAALNDRTSAAPLLFARPRPNSPVYPEDRPKVLPRVHADSAAFEIDPVFSEQVLLPISQVNRLSAPPTRPTNLVSDLNDG